MLLTYAVLIERLKHWVGSSDSGSELAHILVYLNRKSFHSRHPSGIPQGSTLGPSFVRPQITTENDFSKCVGTQSGVIFDSDLNRKNEKN